MNRLLEKGPLVKGVNKTGGYTNICCGLGVDKDVPVRVAAYVVPVLQLSEQFPSAEIELYTATKFSARLNGLNRTDAERNAAVIKEYFNLIQDRLRVTRSPVGLGELDPFTANRLSLLNDWTRLLKNLAPTKVLDFANRRSGDDSLRYMGAHVLYMWDRVDISPDLFITDRRKAPESLLMVGGPAEKIFYDARRTICDALPIDYTRLTDQVFTEIGRKPPYIPIADEPTILSGKKGSRISYENLVGFPDPDVRRDALYLLASLSEALTFSDVEQIRKKGIKFDWQREALAASCAILKEIIGQLES